MYKDGWIASCKLDRIPWALDPTALEKFAPGAWDPEKDVWEVYNTTEDFSQANDLAQKFPEKLNEMKALFWEEAEKYNVTPLLGGMASFFGVLPPNAGKTTKFTFYSGVENVGPGMIPHIYGTSYAIEADIVIPTGGAEGVIVANADFLGGFSLYVQNGKLHHTYSFLGIPLVPDSSHPMLVKLLEKLGDTNTLLRGIAKGGTISSPEPLPAGHIIVRFEFSADAPKPATGGATKLLVNGKTVAEGGLEHTVPGRFSGYAGMDIGRDNRAPVSPTYKSPFAFTGTIKTVTFDLEPMPKSPEEHAALHEAAHQTRVLSGVNG
jgi:arylsulfatase